MSIYKDNLLGYLYVVTEHFPGPDSVLTCHKDIVYRDTLEGAETILAALIETSYEHNCYGIRLQAIWKQKPQEEEKK